jgi:hypothetical protein
MLLDMSRYEVKVNGSTTYRTRGKNDAFCKAGETRDTLAQPASEVRHGESVSVFRDGVEVLRHVWFEGRTRNGNPLGWCPVPCKVAS